MAPSTGDPACEKDARSRRGDASASEGTTVSYTMTCDTPKILTSYSPPTPIVTETTLQRRSAYYRLADSADTLILGWHADAVQEYTQNGFKVSSKPNDRFYEILEDKYYA
jgi:hypothetical protein